MTENFIRDKGNGEVGDFVIQSMEVESAGYNRRGSVYLERFSSSAKLTILFSSMYEFRQVYCEQRVYLN